MWARTTPAEPSSGPKSRPASFTPSVDSNVIGREPVLGGSPPQAPIVSAAIARAATTFRARGRAIGAVTPRLPPLLAQLQALVPGALEQLLVLLLAHLLPALLHEGRQGVSAFHSVPKRFRRSTRFARKLSSRRTEPSL